MKDIDVFRRTSSRFSASSALNSFGTGADAIFAVKVTRVREFCPKLVNDNFLKINDLKAMVGGSWGDCCVCVLAKLFRPQLRIRATHANFSG